MMKKSHPIGSGISISISIAIAIGISIHTLDDSVNGNSMSARADNQHPLFY